jgi:hypothetical protein
MKKYKILTVTIIWLFFVLPILGEDTEPVKIAVAPAYPSDARTKQISGTIKVEVMIDITGNVITAKAIKEEDFTVYSAFNAVSEKAALHWKFKANSEKYKDRKYMLIFSYKIMPDTTPEYELTTIYHYPYEIEIRSHGANQAFFEGFQYDHNY